MKRFILSSAIIGQGDWTYKIISAQEAHRWLSAGEWESAIVYEATASALSLILETPIPAHKKMVRMQPGDEALIIRLSNARKGGNFNPTIRDVLGSYEMGMMKRLA